MFTEQQLKVVKFCAEECNRQESGELSVANMVGAWHFATRAPWHHRTVMLLGMMVEPIKNQFGFRVTPVVIDHDAIPAANIPQNIETLMDNQGYWFNDEMAEAFYQAFERIHPFIDGNGRVGAILYNMLLGRMNDPITPPKFRR
jgi:hypothetical protein